MRSPSRPVERAQPLLGTIVRMRVTGLEESRAHAAITDAFGIIADVHGLMSFHEIDSELSRLNRSAWREPVRVHAHTREVLTRALEIAALSEGLFDPTVAPMLVEGGRLPAPDGAAADPSATWRDIRLHDDGTVTFAKPLWIDLGGIAKGYAVDCALAHINASNPTHACVEAGGDLRLSGEGAEHVYLAAPHPADSVPALKVENAAVASSGSQVGHASEGGSTLLSPHVDTRSRTFCNTDRFVTVVAPHCIDADALTKVVMAAGAAARPVLECYQAQAFMYERATWTRIPDYSQFNLP
jgi:thiamine biosynthesis lipoprotein